MQEDDLIMCECFCKGFVNFMLNNKAWHTLLAYFHQMILDKMIKNIVTFLLNQIICNNRKLI